MPDEASRHQNVTQRIHIIAACLGMCKWNQITAGDELQCLESCFDDLARHCRCIYDSYANWFAASWFFFHYAWWQFNWIELFHKTLASWDICGKFSQSVLELRSICSKLRTWLISLSLSVSNREHFQLEAIHHQEDYSDVNGMMNRWQGAVLV